MINKGTLKGGKIVFKIHRGDQDLDEFESNWAILPRKGDLIDFKDCDMDAKLEKFSTSMFRCTQVIFKPGLDRSMGYTNYKVNVIVKLEPYG